LLIVPRHFKRQHPWRYTQGSSKGDRKWLRVPPASKRVSSAEALGLKLLQSVRKMKAAQAARVTNIEPNDVVQARHNTGLSQAQFAMALSISMRTLHGVGARSPHPFRFRPGAYPYRKTASRDHARGTYMTQCDATGPHRRGTAALAAGSWGGLLPETGSVLTSLCFSTVPERGFGFAQPPSKGRLCVDFPSPVFLR
jgi:putative transcriptional regulator